MSASVVFLLLVGSSFHLTTATECDYRTILDNDDYLIDATDDLYCFDSTSTTINQWSKKCSDDDALRQPRETDMGFACQTGTLVGYTQYDCDADTGVLGADITNDATLTVYTSCISDPALVCAGANIPSDTASKLHIDPAYNVEAVDLVPEEIEEEETGEEETGEEETGEEETGEEETGEEETGEEETGEEETSDRKRRASRNKRRNNKWSSKSMRGKSRTGKDVDDDTVYYPLACADGYGFDSGIGAVYGYCSGTDENNINTFSVHPDVTDAGCYALCPANPTTLEVTPDNMDRVVIDTAQQSGSITVASVLCTDGYMLAHGAAETYEFTCTGTLDGEANSGIYSCAEGACPVCVPACPVSPFELSKVTNAMDVANLAGVTITDALADGATVSAAVECAEGFSLGIDSPEQYQVTCTSTESTDAFSGQYTMTTELPVCASKCANDNYVSIENVQTTVITSGGILGEKISGTVVCMDGFSHGYGIEDEHEFKCSEGAEVTADGGEFACGDDGCPECLPVCEIPADDTIFTYSLADGKDIAPHQGKIPKGLNIIELGCVDELLNLAGARFYSCKNGSLGHEEAEEPTCDADPVCSHPLVINGQVSTFNNLKVGGNYTVSCKSAHWFDVKTATDYGDGTKKSFYEIDVPCLGDEFPEFVCHLGCQAPDFQGSTYPDMNTEGNAPYEMGAVVNFQCLDNQAIVDGQAEATCEPGGIPSPVCGACSFTISIILLLLPTLLL